MGNAESDRNEDKAWNVIKCIPVVNLAYGVVRTNVYVGKQDTKRAILSLTDSTACAVGTVFGGVGGGFAAGVACAAIEAATIPVQDM